jgi:hypothetical protein
MGSHELRRSPSFEKGLRHHLDVWFARNDKANRVLARSFDRRLTRDGSDFGSRRRSRGCKGESEAADALVARCFLSLSMRVKRLFDCHCEMVPAVAICNKCTALRESEDHAEAIIRWNKAGQAKAPSQTETAKDPTWFVRPTVIPGLIIATLAYRAYL